MYIISIAFLAVFALGMAACVVHLMQGNRKLKMQNAGLRSKNAGLRIDVRALRFRNREQRKQIRNLGTTLRINNEAQLKINQQLDDAHKNLEMVLGHECSCRGSSVGVEVGRAGISYIFGKDKSS